MKRKISNRYFTAENLADNIATKSWTNSRLCDIAEWEEAEFVKIAEEIMGTEAVPKHRKIWEFAATVLALKELDLLNSNSVCLSVAAGNERILFYLANKLAGIVASDIYGDGDFSNKEANLSFLENQKQFAPYAYNEANLCAAYSNALELKFPENSFDFSFCMSSIEHFGSIRNSRKAIQEMARVTKPGGYVFITTEIAINDYKTDEVFKLKDISKLIKDTNLVLSSDFKYCLSNDSLQYLCDMRKDDWNKLPHLNLKTYCSIFTSGLLILKKNGEYFAEKNVVEKKQKLWQIASSLNKAGKIDIQTSIQTRFKKKILNTIWKFQEKFI